MTTGWVMRAAAAAALVLSMPAGAQPEAGAARGQAVLREQVVEVERAFARSMAERDARAFAAFISAEAVFFSGGTPLRGRDAVVAAWARYFVGPQAPFSWEPDDVEVLPSGTLARSSGPVRDGAGKLLGRFTSIWRQEVPGQWRIVFDQGEAAGNCARH